MTQTKWLSKACYTCSKKVTEEEAIIVDDDNDIIFCSDDCLQKHFEKELELFNKEQEQLIPSDDIQREQYENYSEILEEILEKPAEIWEDSETLGGSSVHNFIGEYSINDETVYYVAVVLLIGDQPTFVFLHFPTRTAEVVEHYRRGRLIYDRTQAEIEVDAEGEDALEEGDELAREMFEAMLRVRQSTDIPELDFPAYLKYRTETISDSDEMWRSADLMGNTVVAFIKDFPREDEESDFTYVVITTEDPLSDSFFVLFSFPTVDSSLVERYRRGQNLHADGLVRRPAH